MFETGMLKLLGTQLAPGALERTVPSTGWTVRQSLAHLAAEQLRFAESLEWAANIDVASGGAMGSDPRLLPAILADLDSSLRRLVARLVELNGEALDAPIGTQTLLDVLRGWSEHAASHAIEMLETLPELRGDPMLLNWLLYQDFSREPAQNALQQQLVAEVRERYANEDDAELIEEGCE